MKTVLFSTKDHERPVSERSNQNRESPHQITFHEARLPGTTLDSITEFETTGTCTNEVHVEKHTQ